LGDISKANAKAAGYIILKLPYQDATLRLIKYDVFYGPELNLNPLSCSRLDERGVASMFYKTGCTIIDKKNDDDVLAKAQRMTNLYWLIRAKPELPSEHLYAAKHSERNEISKWHNRLAHLNIDKILQLMRRSQLIPKNEGDNPCSFCVS
jgi:GAG-pre-integrase domain